MIPNINAVIFTCKRQPNNGLTFVFCSYLETKKKAYVNSL